MGSDEKFDDHLEKFQGTGPLMRYEDLGVGDQELIASEIFKLAKDLKDPYNAYFFVITKYGLICPHPQIKRLYGSRKSNIPLSDYKWYDCEMCGCSVVNEIYSVENEEENSNE